MFAVTLFYCILIQKQSNFSLPVTWVVHSKSPDAEPYASSDLRRVFLRTACRHICKHSCKITFKLIDLFNPILQGFCLWLHFWYILFTVINRLETQLLKILVFRSIRGTKFQRCYFYGLNKLCKWLATANQRHQSCSW